MSKEQHNKTDLLTITKKVGFFLQTNYTTFRKRFTVFFLFVILATAFWYFRALNDVYHAENTYPIEFINLPKNRILAGNPPQRVTLGVKGTGFTILNNKINPPTIQIDVNKFYLGQQSIDSFNLYLLTRNNINLFANELNKNNINSLELTSITPDTLALIFTKTRSKKVPVTVLFNKNKDMFERQFIQNGKIEIVPDSIVLVGPATLIDPMNQISTETITLRGLNDTLTKRVKLQEFEGVLYSAEKVKITIPVDRFTEASFEIPLMTKKVPDSLILKPFPRNVKVNYRVPLSKYNKVTETDFRPYIDYTEAISDTTLENKIKVYIDSLPDFIHSVSIYPGSVEFLIEQNDAQNRTYRGNW